MWLQKNQIAHARKLMQAIARKLVIGPVFKETAIEGGNIRGWYLRRMAGTITQYICGLGGVALIATAQLQIEKLDAPLFSLFFWCLLCSRFMGIGPAMAAIGFSTIIGNFFFVSPLMSFSWQGIGWLLSAAYATMALLSLWFLQSIMCYADFQNKIVKDQKEAAKKNAALNVALQEAVTTRDNLVAIAGHELKTPLTALYIHAQAWQRKASMHAQNIANDKLQKSWSTQLDSVRRMVHLVEKLLDVSQLQESEVGFDNSTFMADKVVEEVIERHRFMFEDAKCIIDARGETDLAFSWDQMRFEQILSNLLSNACKYAPGAPICIRWEAKADGLRLTVRDCGPGIAAAEQHRIFSRFERLNGPHHRKQGLGLGLWISKKIVDAAGGTISVRSSTGLGAEFTVHLPPYKNCLLKTEDSVGFAISSR